MDEKKTAGLLAEDNIIDVFNDLMEGGLIHFQDGKLRLTGKGEEVKKQVKPLKDEPAGDLALAEFSEKKGKLGTTFFLISLFLSLVSIVLFCVIYWGGIALLENMIWM